MRIKRYAALFLAAALALSLAGCGMNEDKNKDKDGGMTIAHAQLTGEEQKLADLLALGMESHHIFSFQAKGAKSLHFNVYELVDGEWSPLPGGGGGGLSEESGRIALTFGKMTEGVRLAYQTEQDNISTSFQITPADDVSNMAFATSTLDTAPTVIELDQEIPLVIQIATSQNELRMYKVDYFGMPRELAKTGYEHIYAITVTFSVQDFGTAPSAPSAPPSAEPSPAE